MKFSQLWAPSPNSDRKVDTGHGQSATTALCSPVLVHVVPIGCVIHRAERAEAHLDRSKQLAQSLARHVQDTVGVLTDVELLSRVTGTCTSRSRANTYDAQSDARTRLRTHLR